MRKIYLLSVLAISAVVVPACSSSEDESDSGPQGKLGAVPEAVVSSAKGPLDSTGSATEVWAIKNQWMDVNTTEGKKAGVAWGANSGLTWEEKFRAWVGSLPKTKGQSSWGSEMDTVDIPTPFGDRKLPGPVLECAEFGMFLRVTFSSWYHLPFFMTGWDDHASRAMYAGHMGFVNSDGTNITGFPRFKDSYKDYEGSWNPGDEWPSDSKLAAKHFTDGSSDENPALGGGGSGKYFDSIFLNKRAGYFAWYLLEYYSSINLADPINLYHIKPETTSAGDVLLERWQKDGIGHTLPVVHVEHTGGEHLAITVANGSMPRVQPEWTEPEQAYNTFTSDYTGGVGNADDGTPYAKLGGGIHRWRVPQSVGGRWQNVVPDRDADSYINSSDIAAISARPKRFEVLLSAGTPEEQRQAFLDTIEAARNKLKNFPASCTGRTTREDAFAKLYTLSANSFQMDRAAVDAQYRKMEDYVFAELNYPQAKTCCWNSTNAAMASIVLAYAQKEQEDNGACMQPTVFRASGGGDGYTTWKNYADSIGQGSSWKTWSEDEPCAGKDVGTDHTATRAQEGQYCK